MQEVIGKIHELHSLLVKKNGDLARQIKENKDQEARLMDKEAHLSAWNKQTADREDSVRHVENLVQLKKDAGAMMAAAKEERSKLEAEKTAWKASYEAQAQEIRNVRELAAQESANNEMNRKAMDKEVERRVEEFMKKVKK